MSTAENNYQDKKEEEEKLLLVFPSIHYTLDAEKHLNSTDWPFTVVPVPPSVNKGCGLGIMIEAKDNNEVCAYLRSLQIEPIVTIKK